MKYSSPELVVVGRAEVLVLGGQPGGEDHPGAETHDMLGLPLGLDD